MRAGGQGRHAGSETMSTQRGAKDDGVGADGDKRCASPGESYSEYVCPSVEQDRFVCSPVEEPGVAFLTDRGDGIPLVVARNPSGRKRRVVDKKDARALVDSGSKSLEI